jgi:hypothetical protein
LAQARGFSELRVLIQPQVPASPTEFKQSLTDTWSLRCLDMSPWWSNREALRHDPEAINCARLCSKGGYATPFSLMIAVM